MTKRIFKIERDTYPYIDMFIKDAGDYLSVFFLKNNPSSELFGLKGFETKFISSIDNVRRMIFIKSDERKIIDIFITELFDEKDYSGYRIDIPEQSRGFLELLENPGGNYEIYTVMECDNSAIAGTQRPRGDVVISRDSKGFPVEVKTVLEGETKASSSVFWMYEKAAELSLECSGESDNEKWAVYVLSSLASELISLGIKPIYLAPEISLRSWVLAEKIGFRDTGYRIIEIEASKARTKNRITK